jgi:hypothetical protein
VKYTDFICTHPSELPSVLNWYEDGKIPESPVINYGTFTGFTINEEGGTYKAGYATYTRSGDDPNFLYARVNRPFIGPGIITIPTSGSVITSRDNGIVYISTRSDPNFKNRYAIVISKLDSLATPGITFEIYQRTDTNSKFYRYNATTAYGLQAFTIEGDEVNGCYISNADYTNNTTLGFMYAMSYSTPCINSNMFDYDPSHWKPWSEVKDTDFICNYPSDISTVTTWYEDGLIPASPTVATYGTFKQGGLVLVSGTTYKEGAGSTKTTVRYTQSDPNGDGNYLYTKQ